LLLLIFNRFEICFVKNQVQVYMTLEIPPHLFFGAERVKSTIFQRSVYCHSNNIREDKHVTALEHRCNVKFDEARVTALISPSLELWDALKMRTIKH
jgi:hypothetical protein